MKNVEELGIKLRNQFNETKELKWKVEKSKKEKLDVSRILVLSGRTNYCTLAEEVKGCMLHKPVLSKQLNFLNRNTIYPNKVSWTILQLSSMGYPIMAP